MEITDYGYLTVKIMGIDNVYFLPVSEWFAPSLDLDAVCTLQFFNEASQLFIKEVYGVDVPTEKFTMTLHADGR